MTDNYSRLSKLLLARNASLYSKLMNIHSFALCYDRRLWSFHPARGYEFMGSLDSFVKRYGGSKLTWKVSLDKFRVLGLLASHKPRMNDPDGYYNTNIQSDSVYRAQKRGEQIRQAIRDFGDEPPASIRSHPVTWHRIPPYTDELLQKAEARVPDILNMGNGINKDAISDLYGLEEANRITDTGYTTHADTLARREMLKSILLATLDSRSYMSSEELLQRARELCPGHSPYRWLETWKAYKPYLFREYRLKEGRPTRAEKEVMGIVSDRHIIRRI